MSSKANRFEGLKAYLTGYGRHNRDALTFIAEYEHWPRLALKEIERRATAILANLPDDEVKAIARRAVSLRKLARQVQTELDKE
ncbi:hypothetical protein [Thauera linaloolentis]|uniref:Uncharacterized protein n=1 Tax=Thauera linaloolentis (strain DSM 12138 / JCM 21573 / CCUG 41526 / CIP 105981 / IAM 15112 / NBRC 102519 / 47Lol) TaxID=1123367 RepID=N6YZ41_THAL4|nr:hypothetical protein [Thauera linaloolentis]ENO87662.1 hypothetical protein C666_10570 [Thauera linaloolentis 47Lol = DSM 12138]MCM8565989.1 hypothetical protein [Thauera linaloolentis]